MGLEIRVIYKCDLPFYYEGEVDSFRRSYPSATINGDVVERMKKKVGKYIMERNKWAFTAVHNKPIGYILLSERNYYEERIGGIDGLYVNEKFRRLGVARSLLDHAQYFLRTQGMTTLELRVSSGNEEAYNLYKSVGFVETWLTMEKEIKL